MTKRSADLPDDMPDWFDPAAHHAGTGGVVETATGILLDTDGLPVNAALRAERSAPKPQRVVPPKTDKE